MAENGRRANWKAKNWRGSASPGGGAPTATGKRKSAGGAKRFVLIAVILALAGGVVGFLAFVREPQRPLFLGIAVTEYSQTSLPVNAWAQQDSDALRTLFGKDSVQARQGQQRSKFVEELKGLVDRTTQGEDKDRPVIVHLSGLGVASRGKVYLLPGNADVDVQSSWLTLEEILTTLRGCKGPCLLLLDIARRVADARLGLLTNDVATALDDELMRLKETDQLPILVLTSCGRGQVAHVSLELRRSAFGFFLEQGLGGLADGWVNGSTDGQVSARELAAYTAAQVANWAALHKLSAQAPKLYGSGTDFTLISPGKNKPALQVPELAAPYDDYPKWLAAGWKERDDWLAGHLDHAAPRTFRQLEAAVGRAEQRWLGGMEEAVVRDKLNDELADLKKLRPEPLDTRPPYSLAVARQRALDDAGDAAAEAKLAGLFEQMLSAKPPDDAALSMAVGGLKLDDTSKVSVGLAALKALATVPNPTQAQLQLFDSFVSKLPPPRFAEFYALRLLVKLDPDQLVRWDDPKLAAVKQRIILTDIAAEQAAAVEPRTLPWVEGELKNANDRRRRGLYLLATGDRPQRYEGYDLLAGAQTRYAGILEAARALKQGFHSVERAGVVLPALVKPLGDRGRDSADARFWNEIQALTAELQPLLTPPAQPALPANPQAIDTLSGSLATRVREFESLARDAELERRIKQAASAVEIRRLLDSPTYRSPERARIFQAARDLGQEREKAALDAALAYGSSPPANSVVVLDDPAWRAKLAIDLLKLDGVTDVKALEAKLKTASAQSSSDAWETLGVDIRNAWVKELTKRFEAPGEPWARIRMGYVLHPFDESALRLPADTFDREPMRTLLIERDQQLREWQAKNRYQADAAAFGANSNRKSDLGEYADNWTEVAKKLVR